MKPEVNRTPVLVTWHDAHDCNTTAWMEPEEIDAEPLVVLTAGFIVSDAKPNHLVVASSVTSEGMLGDVLAIPIAMVQTVKTLTFDV